MYNHRETDRVEYFSDAVIAIAATLLAVELPVPTGKADLIKSMAHEWPTYAAFATSFLFIGITWANHHNMFLYIEQTDHQLLILNLFFLLFITFQSFSTKLLVHHIDLPTQREAALIYYGIFILTGLWYNLTWWYAIRSKLVKKNTTPDFLRSLSFEYMLAPVMHISSFIIAFWSVPFSLIPFVVLYIYFALPRFSERKLAKTIMQATGI